jgi:hypothetical protein
MQRGSIFFTKNGTLVAISVAALLAIYTVSALVFSKALATDRVSPTVGALFFYGRAALIQILSIGCGIKAFTSTLRYLRRSQTRRVVVLAISTMIAIVVYAAALYLISVAMRGLDAAVFWAKGN